jgi:hypothetical protein
LGTATPSSSPVPSETPPSTASPTPTGSRVCVGDCDGDDQVVINELITMVNLALDLGTTSLSACVAGDANGDGVITIDEIIRAVNYALTACPAAATG